MGNEFSCIHHSTVATCTISSTATQNHAPCISGNTGHPRHHRRRRPLITIVSLLDGRARRFKAPLNVGELMLAMPGHFVAELNGQEQDGYMLRSKRISALPEDRNLSALHVYYLLPMNRLNTHLGTSELRKIVMASRIANSDKTAPYITCITHAGSKITPLSSSRCEETAFSNVEGGEESRQWQPVRPRTHRRKILHFDNRHSHQREDVGAVRGAGDDEHGLHEIAMHTQRSLSKPRNWEPRLDTIAELRPSDD